MCKKIKIQNVSALFRQTGILKTKCHFLRTAKTYNTSICAFNLQAYNLDSKGRQKILVIDLLSHSRTNQNFKRIPVRVSGDIWKKTF